MKSKVCEDLERSAVRGQPLFRVAYADADFSGAKLRTARLPGVRFTRCKLDFSDLTEAYLPRAVFDECVINDAQFSGTYLRGARFVKCKFRNANLYGANLAEAVFEDCDIMATDLSYTEFSEASLRNCRLKNCKAFLADFTNVQPQWLNGIQDEIREALLPPGFTPVAANAHVKKKT
ncbi:MAG: pentapeptide repeat-containing protein [Fibrobacterota bacterium]